MKGISNNGVDFLINVEGTKLHVYLDSVGFPTIGTGHLLTKSELSSGKIKINGIFVRYKNGMTYDQAGTLLQQDLESVINIVNHLVKVELTQNQFDALVSFTYNVGKNAFENSTLLKLLNQGFYDEVPIQMLRWNKAGGRIVKGLTNRRNAEIELWNKK
jgi:lysozyme